MAAKDWVAAVGAITGILALGVSTGSAVFNYFLQKDDLRVVLDSLPEMYNAGPDIVSGSGIAVRANQQITFINSGNRSAAITRIQLLAVQPEKGAEKTEDCSGGMTIATAYDLDPFVIKPGEILLKTLRLKKNIWPEYNGYILNYMSHLNRERDHFLVTLCMGFSIISPDNYMEEIKRPLYSKDMPRDVPVVASPGEPIIDWGHPVVLLHNTVFSQSR